MFYKHTLVYATQKKGLGFRMPENTKYQRRFEPYEKELIEIRRHLHRHPELGLQEFETSAFIRDYLEKLGYRLTKVEPTGWIAEHPCQETAAFADKKQVVLRSEMDALPIQEQTGLPFASEREGVMHACGHDGIVATALILAKILAKEKEQFPVKVRFLFEPAEEIGEGAKRMLSAGALEPKPDAFLMFHYAVDMPFGMAVHEGQASAMINGMEIRVHGKSSHWCQASQGIDSIYAASLVVQALHDLNETYQGKGPCLVGIGTFHGGEYSNIITDLVTLRGNIRAAYEEDYQALDEKMQAVLQEIEKRTGTRIEIEYPKPAVLPFANDASLTRIAAAAGKKVFGEHFILEDENQLFLSGDNAYRYFQKSRGLFSVFLAGIPGKTYPLHHPKFQIDEAVLPYSLEALYEILAGISREEEN